MNKKWVSTSDNPCPSCAALNGIIRTEEEWSLRPKDDHLYCKDACTCHFEDTEDETNGDFSAVPLRGVGTVGALDDHSARLSNNQVQRTEAMQKDFKLKATVTPTEQGFSILAINEGEAKGHGISFSANVLKLAVQLYEGKPVFIDHAEFYKSPSVRDLAGTLSSAEWDETNQGIRATLTPTGPAAETLISLRNAAKTAPAIMEAVGFSTVLRVQLDKDSNVTKIVSVKSVDVVIDPARGGKFLQEINGAHAGDQRASRVSLKRSGGLKMAPKSKKFKTEIANAEGVLETVELQGVEIEPYPIEAQLTANAQAAAELLGEHERQQAMDAQLQQSNETLVALCQNLLTTGLGNSKLPAVTQGRIERQFKGRVFKAEELTLAIKEAREEIAALNDASNIAGPGRITGMYDVKEDFVLAMSDMFGVEREEKDKNRKVHQLQGLRDAYLKATGDQYFTGGFHPEYALVSANFPGIVANVQNKILNQAWDDFDEAYGWWKNIVTIKKQKDLKTVTWVRTGTIATLPSVAERGEYTELGIGDIKETSDFTKYGGYVPLTLESVINDDLDAFMQMPRELALAGIRLISELVAAIFTVNSGAGPTMTDTGALFNATAQTTAGGHANLLTTALGTDYTAWNAVATAMYKKKLMVKNAAGYYGTGKPQALKPSFCLVPADLIAQAEALFVPRWDAPAQNVPATQSPRWGGRVTPLAVPEWTDATDWAAVIDPKLRPGIMLGHIFGIKPQIFSASSEIDPAMFANDESRLKVRQFVTVGVADDLPLHKSNVAG
jgi:hypothetical protein